MLSQDRDSLALAVLVLAMILLLLAFLAILVGMFEAFLRCWHDAGACWFVPPLAKFFISAGAPSIPERVS
jgi:hypothetical protein